jgi:hypothetical protein
MWTCPLCGEKVRFAHADNGKLVHTLQGDIYQVVNLYSCRNHECEFSKIAFNPSPRFDYGGRYYGADVVRFIAEEFLLYSQKPEQIYERITKKYELQISEGTIRRICDDVLKLKSLKIDEKTLELVKRQNFILLGFDGQDPGSEGPALWCFMDLVSNRVLVTRKFDSLDFNDLHSIIEELQTYYGVKIVGWVSDKQNVITKCHDEFYPDVPHQYCQFHFLRNQWNLLEALDSNVFLPLKKAINSLYIHTASKSSSVCFENVGTVSVREAFKNTDKDLQTMAKARNKTLKELRGAWLYEKLTEYMNAIEIVMKDKDPTYRFTKIMNKTVTTLQTALTEVKPYYEDSRELYRDFQQIREVFGTDSTSKEEKEKVLGVYYDLLFAKAKARDLTLTLDDAKSFLPNKQKSTAEIMCEWCRLWNSYRPGLFQYYTFPEIVKTNAILEQGFSMEKQALFGRVAKGNVSHMIATRGEDILRIQHCNTEELEADVVLEYSEEVVRRVRAKLRADIKERTKMWRTKSKCYQAFTIDLEQYYQYTTEKKGGCIIVG